MASKEAPLLKRARVTAHIYLIYTEQDTVVHENNKNKNVSKVSFFDILLALEAHSRTVPRIDHRSVKTQLDSPFFKHFI